MQDNTPIHTAKKILKWFTDWTISMLDWPLYSSDLNPIEHMWVKMKQWINDNYLHLKKIGESQAVYDELAQVIVEAWKAIPQDYIDGLIKSMNNWVNTVLTAKEWHTKY